MFALCDGMKWAHLPVAGGLYDQDPKLLDAFRFIFARRAEEEEKRRRRDEAKAKNNMGNSGMMRHSSRAR